MPSVAAPPCKSPKGEPINWGKLSGNEVLLNVYDLGETNAMRKVNAASAAIGGGVYHAGVEIFGVEFAYGSTETPSTGVTKCYPRCHPGHTYRSTVQMGTTKLSEMKVQRILERMVDEWRGTDYHFIRKNCLDFSNALCQELGVGKIPAWVDRYGRTAEKLGNVLYSPVGAFRKSTRMLTGRGADQSPSRNIEKSLGGFRGRSGQAVDLRDRPDDHFGSDFDSDGEDYDWGRGRSSANAVTFSLSEPSMGYESSSQLKTNGMKRFPSQPVPVPAVPVLENDKASNQKDKPGSKKPLAKEKAKAQAQTKAKAKGKAKSKGKAQATSQAKSKASKTGAPASKTGPSKTGAPTPGSARQTKQQVVRSDPRGKLVTSLFNDYDEDKDGHLNESELRCFAARLGFDGDESVWSIWYADSCQALGADPGAGLDTKQFKQLVTDSSDAELEKLRKPAVPPYPPPLPPPATPPPADLLQEEVEVASEAGEHQMMVTGQHRGGGAPDAKASSKGRPKQNARKDLTEKLFDVFDQDSDARLNQIELRCFADRLGFEGSEDQWSDWYSNACSQVVAEVLVGFSKDQFFDLTADIELAELKNMLADLESSKSTELPEGASPDSFSAEADSARCHCEPRSSCPRPGRGRCC